MYWIRGWLATEQLWTWWKKKKKPLPLPGVKPKLPGHPVHGIVITLTKLPQHYSWWWIILIQLPGFEPLLWSLQSINLLIKLSCIIQSLHVGTFSDKRRTSFLIILYFCPCSTTWNLDHFPDAALVLYLFYGSESGPENYLISSCLSDQRIW